MPLLVLLIIIAFVVISIVAYLIEASFETRKANLMHIYSSLLSDMNVDYTDTEVRPKNIIDIGKSILNFSQEIRETTRISKSMTPEQQEWLTKMIEEFTDNLDIWMNRHADELKLQANEIQDMETTLTEGKSALLLASKRLEMQVENLKKAEVLI